MKVTYIGHATVLIELDGKYILTDPNYSNWLFLLPRQKNPGIPFDKLPPLDLILVSHAHYDHLSKHTMKRLSHSVPVRCASGMSGIIKRLGFSNVAAMRDWESHEVSGLRLTAVPSRHFGGRMFLAGGFLLGYTGFILEGKEGTIYFPGDTAYSDRYFQEIGNRFKIDIALLPIGAYKPRLYLQNKHMNPHDAIRAFLDLKARYMVPIHWGTFKLGFEFLSTPIRWTKILSKQYDIEERVKILHFGESFGGDSRRQS